MFTIIWRFVFLSISLCTSITYIILGVFALIIIGGVIAIIAVTFDQMPLDYFNHWLFTWVFGFVLLILIIDPIALAFFNKLYNLNIDSNYRREQQVHEFDYHGGPTNYTGRSQGQSTEMDAYWKQQPQKKQKQQKQPKQKQQQPFSLNNFLANTIQQNQQPQKQKKKHVNEQEQYSGDQKKHYVVKNQESYFPNVIEGDSTWAM